MKTMGNRLGTQTSDGRRRRVTVKERKFVKKLIETGNKREAAFQVYDTKSRHNAGQVAKAVMSRPIVQEYMRQALDRAGLTIDEIGNKMGESVDFNMKFGKPSQAVAASLLQFSAKLHDVVPANKNLNVSAKVGGLEELPTDMSTLTQTLKELTESNRLILESLNK